MSGSAATVYDLTPFPPPPSPPRAGLFGWIKSHVSPKQSTSTELIYSYESPIAPDSSSPSQSPQQNPRPLIARQIQSRRRPPNGIYRYSSELDPSTSHTRVTEHENTGLEMIHFPQLIRKQDRRVTFGEPTTTAFFSPPSVVSGGCSPSSSSSNLSSELLDSVSPLSVIAADSPRPDGSVIRQEWSPPLPPLAEDTEEEPSPSLPPPSQHLSINLVEAREFDASLTRLVENDVGNMAPFMVFLLGMPFVGVATQHGCVSSMGYGIKRAIGTVRIDGGKSILYRVKETARALPRCCWDTEKIADEEIEIELPVYGVEYTAYDVENHHREVAR